MKINRFNPEAELLCNNCHLRYIFNYALKITYFSSKFIFISSIMGIYVLHTMCGKDNYLTVSKLQTSCFYHNHFNMITPQNC